MTKPNLLLEAALNYALQLKWPVIALNSIVKKTCTCKDGAVCRSPGKHPRWHQTFLSNGLLSASTDEMIIRKWWEIWPRANIAVVTGPQTFDVIDIDFDLKTGEPIGEDSLRRIYEETGFVLPKTVEQLTGGGGRQLFFNFSGRLSTTTKGPPGIHIRSTGGYVVVPPSFHVTGKNYEWEALGHPEEIKRADLPEWFSTFINLYEHKQKSTSKQVPPSFKNENPQKKTQKENDSKNPDGWVTEALFGIKEGGRNEMTAKLAGYYLRKFQGDTEQTLLILNSWNLRNIPPLPENEIRKVVESIAKRQGRDELGDAIGQDGGKFQKIEILEYPDGTKSYRVFFKPSAEEEVKTVQMGIKELGQFSIFKFKFAEASDCFPAPIKQPNWERMVNKALAEAEHIQMTMDEVKLGIVRGAIASQVLDEHIRTSDLTYINNRIVVAGENGTEAIAVKLKTMMNLVRTENEKITRKEMGEFLRAMGFTNTPLYDTGRSIRCWHTGLKKWTMAFGDSDN